MSLIIGIRCQDGIVVGSDSAATLGTLRQPTITQRASKIKLPAPNVICAVAGPVGIGQRFAGCVRDLWNNEIFRAQGRHDMMSSLAQGFFGHAEIVMKAANAAKEIYGKAAWENAVATAIVALPLEGGPALFWFDDLCSGEEVKEDLPFVSIGSGAAIADPFLAFIKRLIWQDKMPSLSVGIFSAIWTLEHVIKTSPSGVGKPIQIMTLSVNESGPVVQEISGTNLAPYDDHVLNAEKAVSSIRDLLVEVTDIEIDTGTSDVPLPAEE